MKSSSSPALGKRQRFQDDSGGRRYRITRGISREKEDPKGDDYPITLRMRAPFNFSLHRDGEVSIKRLLLPLWKRGRNCKVFNASRPENGKMRTAFDRFPVETGNPDGMEGRHVETAV